MNIKLNTLSVARKQNKMVRLALFLCALLALSCSTSKSTCCSEPASCEVQKTEK